MKKYTQYLFHIERFLEELTNFYQVDVEYHSTYSENHRFYKRGIDGSGYFDFLREQGELKAIGIFVEDITLKTKKDYIQALHEIGHAFTMKEEVISPENENFLFYQKNIIYWETLADSFMMDNIIEPLSSEEFKSLPFWNYYLIYAPLKNPIDPIVKNHLKRLKITNGR